ncbi:MAG: PQQ-binding-like beta-propeller repeat protein [Proteobacteria bacterium]|nr:PQQ-binding-like beta-propeller repeat protein [Pseudomonadota bacterium]
MPKNLALSRFANSRLLALFAVLLSLGLAGCTTLKSPAASSDWPSAFHDSGRTNSTAEEITTPLVSVWSKDLAPVAFNKGMKRIQLSSPAISGGVLYVGSTDRRLYAFELATGRRLWRFEADGAIESSPTVTETKVCFGSSGGFFRCLDKSEGRELWSFRAKSEITGSALDGTGGPDGKGLIYLYSADDRLYALDSATGERVWVYSRTPFFTVSRRIISSPASDAETGRIYQLFSDGALVALDATTGSVLWEKQVIEDFWEALEARRTPIVDGKALYIIDGNSSVLALNSVDGTERDIETADHATDIVLSDKQLLVAGTSSISLLDRRGAKLLWKKELERGSITTLIVAGNKIVLLSAYEYEPAGIGFLARERGYLEVLSLKNGSSIWAKSLKGTVTAGASVGNGAIALFRNDGLLSLYTQK